MVKTKRNSSIETLRIISMIIIVFSHFAIHSSFNNNDLTFNKLYILLIQMGGL